MSAYREAAVELKETMLADVVDGADVEAPADDDEDEGAAADLDFVEDIDAFCLTRAWNSLYRVFRRSSGRTCRSIPRRYTFSASACLLCSVKSPKYLIKTHSLSIMLQQIRIVLIQCRIRRPDIVLDQEREDPNSSGPI